MTFFSLQTIMADKDIMFQKRIVEPDGYLDGLIGSDLLNDEVVSEQLTRFDC